MSIYLGDFTSKEDVASEFEVTLSDDIDILLAWYGREDYDGSAFVFYRQGGKLYEVNGSHCSCYGLEDQWEPEETTAEALRMREFYSFDLPKAELLKVLNELEQVST